VYRGGSRKGHSFSLGIHTMLFQVEIYAIKACIMENIEKGYTGRNINILSDGQAAITALESFQINSISVWDCHQSLMKLAEHTWIQMVLYKTYAKGAQNAQPEQKLAKDINRAGNRTLPIKGYLFKLGQVKSPECDRCKHASETTSHIFVTETLATLRFRHLGHHFMKPCDFEDMPVSRILHFVQVAGLLDE